MDPLFSDREWVIHWLSKNTQKELQKNPEAWIEKANAEASDASEKLYELAAAFYVIRQPEEAIKLCRRSLMKNLNYLPSLYSLSLLHFEKSLYDEAKRLFLRALRIDPQPAASVLYVQKRLRALMQLPEATKWGLWCLEELHRLNKSSPKTQFERGKLLFERSQFKEAAPVLQSLMADETYAHEVSQYLSYIYERLYRGDELIEKVLELAALIKEPSDLLFNLAMVCQHDQGRLDLAIHFFYLASQADPEDPGLKFSLEQACVEYIGAKGSPKKPEEHLHLLLAHYYHGSVAVAERYAKSLRQAFHWQFPQNFQDLIPSSLWKHWLVKDRGPFSQVMEAWFSERPLESWRELGKKSEGQ